VPLWLQTQQGYTAFWAGIAIAPIGLFAIMFSMIIGKYLHLFDLRNVTALGFIIFALSYYYQSWFTTAVDIQTIMLSRFYLGCGISFFFLPITQLSLSSIPKERYASASGLFHFMRILVGSGFGTSLSIEFWSRFEIFHHARLSDYVTSYRPVIDSFEASLTNINPVFTEEVVRRILDIGVEQQAYMLSTNDLSWISAWLFLLMIPLIYMCNKVEGAQQVEAIH
jgi:DHA2 family multidrug resistance protein